MEQGRLSVVITGAYAHPFDQTAIDARYGELVDSPDLPHKTLQHVGGEAVPLDTGARAARFVLITNATGSELERYPTPAEAAALRRCVLLVCDQAGRAICALPPADPGRMPQGCSQPLFLAEGVRLTLRAAHPDAQCVARVVAVPGADPLRAALNTAE